MIKKRMLIAGMIGNALEHYNHALFSLLAPFLAPLFFPNHSLISSLIYTYSMLFLGIFSRPLGALFFGYIGDFLGRKKALFLTIFGMGITTIFMGCIPTYASIKGFAPLVLALGKILQGFFAAGETPGGAIFVLEQCKEEKKSFYSSLYEISTIFGILLASLMVTLFGQYNILMKHWRWLFFFAAFSLIIGFFIRFFTEEPKEFVEDKNTPKEHLWNIIKIYHFKLVAIIFIIGFSYVCYSLAVTMMNGFLPLISSISKLQAMKINTYLLIFDLLLLPCCGLLAQRFTKERCMLLASFSMILLIFPIFFLLKNSSFFQAALLRSILVFIGVAFSAPLHHFVQQWIAPKHRFQAIAFSFAIGSMVIGKPTSALSIWLFQKTAFVFAPAFYVLPIAMIAFLSMHFLIKSQKEWSYEM